MISKKQMRSITHVDDLPEYRPRRPCATEDCPRTTQNGICAACTKEMAPRCSALVRGRKCTRLAVIDGLCRQHHARGYHLQDELRSTTWETKGGAPRDISHLHPALVRNLLATDPIEAEHLIDILNAHIFMRLVDEEALGRLQDFHNRIADEEARAILRDIIDYSR